jgi:hypothetical protein
VHDRSTRRVVLCVGLAILLALGALVLLASGALRGNESTLLLQDLPTIPLSGASAVARENALPGDRGWQLDAGVSTTFIQGYAGVVSALPGDTVPLYISTAQPSRYDLTVYRIGWYGGLGGRALYTEHGLVGVPQGTWTLHEGLVGCAHCALDPTTHRLEARWQQSATLSLGATWLSGVYLIKLTAAHQGESYIPLVVRNDTGTTAALANLPVSTYQAYNVWGGYSTYGHIDRAGQLSERDRAVEVSFDRPYDRSAGAGDFLSWDIHLVRWMERAHLDVSYTTDPDVHAHPESLLRHRIFVVMAHDEYYTLAMRDGVERARDAGVNLAFMGADAIYWQNRFASDFRGQMDRTLICYKVQSDSNGHDPTAQPTRDPLYPQLPALVTTRWRDAIIGRPESNVIGLMYAGIVANNTRPDWVVSAPTAEPMFYDTGVRTGMHVRGGILGYEYDGAGPSSATPAGLVILARSRVVSRYGATTVAMTSYYRAPSGALVFDAGSIWWGWGLDELSLRGAPQRNTVGGNWAITRLTTNIFAAMLGTTGVTTPTQVLPMG